jgi:hypothetical protein
MDRSDFIKLGVSIALDILDFTLGRITGAGTVLDLVFAAVAVALWGPAGLLQLWETLDPTDQLDGFMPTMTLIALSQIGRKRTRAR